MENDHLTAVFSYQRAFDPEECAAIRRIAQSQPQADVDVYPAPPVPVRRARTRVLPEGPDTRWIEERILLFAYRANSRYAFDLTHSVRPLMLVSYGIGDFFDWHTDLGDGRESTRKISISVQVAWLAEYDGGEIEIVGHGKPLPRAEMGTLTAFPAHLAHRVCAVTRGERHALVSWVHGVAFR